MADKTFSAQLADASRALRRMSTEVRREIRPALKRAAEPMVRQAKANASWSTRIPGAIRLSIARRTGVDIQVSSARAPHARPLEGIQGNSSFRHPVFGNRGVWVEQRTRPYLQPAVEAHKGKVRSELIKVVDDAAVRNGYR